MEYEEIKSNFKQWENEGDFVEGRLVDIREGNYGKVFDIDTNEGKVTVGGTVIANKLTQEMIGKQVKIIYKGEIRGKNKVPYKDFQLFIERSRL